MMARTLGLSKSLRRLAHHRRHPYVWISAGGQGQAAPQQRGSRFEPGGGRVRFGGRPSRGPLRRRRWGAGSPAPCLLAGECRRRRVAGALSACRPRVRPTPSSGPVSSGTSEDLRRGSRPAVGGVLRSRRCSQARARDLRAVRRSGRERLPASSPRPGWSPRSQHQRACAPVVAAHVKASSRLTLQTSRKRQGRRAPDPSRRVLIESMLS
jgi:hypothetical protein